MKLLAIAAAAATLSLAIGFGARAQTAGLYVFVTVDAVSSQYTNLRITGILEGQATATELRLIFSGTDYGAQVTALQTCERKALLAMTKPGQYRFEVTPGTSGYPTCKLARVNP